MFLWNVILVQSPFHLVPNDSNSSNESLFKTIIFVYSDSISKAFEGKVDGYISDSISGNGGFGYDNIFIPIKYKDTKKTYADIGDEKNDISHRRLAINKMLKFMESEE